MTNFSKIELGAMKTVTQKSIVAYLEYRDGGIYDSGSAEFGYDLRISSIENYDDAYSVQTTDTMFLLDVKQVNAVYNNRDILGEKYFMADTTEQCLQNDNPIIVTGYKCPYWLRTPDTRAVSNVRCITGYTHVKNEHYIYSNAAYYTHGIRPAFYLADAANLQGTGTEGSPYTISGEPVYVTSFDSEVSAWSSSEMEEAYAKNLIPENLAGEDLTAKVSRSEFASIAVKLYEALSEESVLVVKTPFEDITGDKNEDEIAKAYGLNIAVGVSDTEFAPNAEINREQLATMLCRTIKKYKFEGWTYDTDSEYYLDTDGVKKFADDDEISDYAKASVYYMVKMGVINGVDDTHFAPRNTTSEEEAVGYATATRERQ